MVLVVVRAALHRENNLRDEVNVLGTQVGYVNSWLCVVITSRGRPVVSHVNQKGVVSPERSLLCSEDTMCFGVDVTACREEFVRWSEG
jgi:hypothetical protein